jgi:hypothetical protein
VDSHSGISLRRAPRKVPRDDLCCSEPVRSTISRHDFNFLGVTASSTSLDYRARYGSANMRTRAAGQWQLDFLHQVGTTRLSASGQCSILTVRRVSLPRQRAASPQAIHHIAELPVVRLVTRITAITSAVPILGITHQRKTGRLHEAAH